MDTRPALLWRRYQRLGGPLASSGIAYNSLFALFAGVWLLFSILGIVIAGNKQLLDATIDTIAKAVPGLIGEHGVIARSTLMHLPTSFRVAEIIAAVLLMVTMLGWVGAVRTAIRTQFELPPAPATPVLSQAYDVLRVVILGILIILSAGLTIVTSKIGTIAASVLGYSETGHVANVLVTIGYFVISTALDFVVFLLLYKWIAFLDVTYRVIVLPCIIGALGTSILKTFGAHLIGTGNNPLLASFATLIGILLWCNIIAQIIVLSSAWSAMRTKGWPAEPQPDSAH